MLHEFIDRLWTTGGGKAMWISGRAKTAVAQHAAILNAMKKRDSALAARLMRKHIAEGAEMHRKRLQQMGHDVPPAKLEIVDGALAAG
jgi:DNA-binding GntR family transcriptional regulator